MVSKRCILCKRVGSKGFFSFPSAKSKATQTKKARENWLVACDLPADADTKNKFVCFMHFKTNEIEEFSNHCKPMPGM